jgi:hypothetical protein
VVVVGVLASAVYVLRSIASTGMAANEGTRAEIWAEIGREREEILSSLRVYLSALIMAHAAASRSEYD